jgi:hypothetical protein
MAADRRYCRSDPIQCAHLSLLDHRFLRQYGCLLGRGIHYASNAPSHGRCRHHSDASLHAHDRYCVCHLLGYRKCCWCLRWICTSARKSARTLRFAYLSNSDIAPNTYASLRSAQHDRDQTERPIREPAAGSRWWRDGHTSNLNN